MAGDVKVFIPEIPRSFCPIDLDSHDEYAESVAACPVARESCTNAVDLGTKHFPDGRRALRVQFYSESPRLLYGRPGRGWAHYVFYLDDGGRIYAKRVLDGASETEEPTEYGLSENKWMTVFVDRAVRNIAESVDACTLARRLGDPQIVAANPAYARGVALDRKANRDAARTQAPADFFAPAFLEQIDLVQGRELACDIDDNSARGFQESLGLLHVNTQWSNDRIIFRPPADGFVGVALETDGEVPSVDGLVLAMTRGGFRVFSEDAAPRTDVTANYLTHLDRLMEIYAGALIAVGTADSPLTRGRAIVADLSEMITTGALLPKSDRLVPGSLEYTTSP